MSRSGEDRRSEGADVALAPTVGPRESLVRRLLSRDRARPNRARCASGVRAHPTTGDVLASNAPEPRAIHDARGLPWRYGVHVSRWPREVHALRERPGADTGLGLRR